MKKSEILTEVLKDLDGASPDAESSLLSDGFMIAPALHHYSEEDRVAVNAALLSLRCRRSSSHPPHLKKREDNTSVFGYETNSRRNGCYSEVRFDNLCITISPGPLQEGSENQWLKGKNCKLANEELVGLCSKYC